MADSFQPVPGFITRRQSSLTVGEVGSGNRAEQHIVGDNLASHVVAVAIATPFDIDQMFPDRYRSAVGWYNEGLGLNIILLIEPGVHAVRSPGVKNTGYSQDRQEDPAGDL